MHDAANFRTDLIFHARQEREVVPLHHTNLPLQLHQPSTITKVTSHTTISSSTPSITLHRKVFTTISSAYVVFNPKKKPASDPFPSCLATGSSSPLHLIRALAHAAKFGVALLIGQDPRINPLMRVLAGPSQRQKLTPTRPVLSPSLSRRVTFLFLHHHHHQHSLILLNFFNHNRYSSKF